MNVNYIIRLAKKEDITSITNILNNCIQEGGANAFLEPQTIESRIDWFNKLMQDSYDIFVIEINNEVIAYFNFSPFRSGRGGYKNVAEFTYYIAKEYRSKGLGNQIFSFSIEHAKIKGYKNLIAILLGENQKSINILKKYGFDLWGSLPEVVEFKESNSTVLIMGLKI